MERVIESKEELEKILGSLPKPTPTTIKADGWCPVCKRHHPPEEWEQIMKDEAGEWEYEQ
jgi:DNA repair exonuclease SbcCD ATPase subunit